MRFSFTDRKHAPLEATDFLRGNARLAALLPAVQRMAKLQQDCWEVLPTAFKSCEVFAFDGGELTLAVPNTAVAAKLKQQVPKMLEALNGHVRLDRRRTARVEECVDRLAHQPHRVGDVRA